MIRKRRYCRLQKSMGDVSLLAGSPADAADHYLTAIDLARQCSDTVWHGAALAGLASTKVGSPVSFLAKKGYSALCRLQMMLTTADAGYCGLCLCACSHRC
jgi:hypothetical protein